MRRLVEDYWDRAPVHIPGAPDKFRDLGFDLEIFFRLCAELPRVKAQYFDRAGEHAEVEITAAQARPLYDSGMTICAGPLNRVHDQLKKYALAVKQGLSLAGPVPANCYLSPAGRGFGLHFDDRAVIILQIEGTKRWFHGKGPAIVGPPGNYDPTELAAARAKLPWFEVAVPPEAELEEQLLRPGDIFYVPAGTWHRAEAGDYSLAITLACHSPSFQDLLLPLMKKHLDHDASWRRRIPAWSAQDKPRHLFAEQLAQVKAWLAAIDAEQLVAEWQRRIDTDEDEGDTKAQPIAPADRLAVPHKPSFSVAGDILTISCQGSSFEVPRELQPFLERLALHDSFVANEALAWSDDGEQLEWDDLREALETLLDAGIIRRG